MDIILLGYSLKLEFWSTYASFPKEDGLPTWSTLYTALINDEPYVLSSEPFTHPLFSSDVQRTKFPSACIINRNEPSFDPIHSFAINTSPIFK